jgi:photosystem II stability/assembly factor-like uncharacterized protein
MGTLTQELRSQERGLRLALLLACLGWASVGSAASPDVSVWLTQPTAPYPKKRDDIVFVNSQTGFYGTGKGQLYRTDDGGHSWRLSWQHEGTFIRSLGFVDQANGFLGNLGMGLGGVTDAAPLYRTTDGGATWEPVHLAQPIAGVCSIDILKTRAIFEGELRDRIIIHAAGRANGPAQMLRSEDGGASWQMIDLSARAGMILDVKFLDAYTGFVFAGTSSDVAQSHALILHTTDGGGSWHEVYRSARTAEIIWKASFPTTRVGYATIQSDDDKSAQQRVAKTTDGGQHWSELPLVTDHAAQEFGVGFVDASHGWVGTAAGGFETRDGGASWSSAPLAPRTNKIRTRASDGTPMVYAIGTEVQVLQDSSARASLDH